MDKIEKKRQELNKLLSNKAQYEKILKVSVELDKLIEKYYITKKS